MNRFRSIFPWVVALAACSTETEQTRLMKEIEQKVQLPKGAEPLNAYVRFYTFSDGGKVLARWLIPEANEPRPGDGCAEVVLGETETTLREVTCDPPAPWPPQGRAGESRWIEHPNDVPVIMDGACRQINIMFDLRTRKVEQAFCNGSS